MSAEGWGGNAPKLHWIVDGAVLCGRRTAPWFKATVDECYSPDDLTRHRAQYCRFCLRLRERSAVDEILGQVFPGRPAESRAGGGT